jgi:hypothetical protein
MKPFVPPIAALALAASWLGARQHSITTLERETVLLRDHLAAARTRPDAPPATRRHGGTPLDAKQPIDWKAAAASLAHGEGHGIGDAREMMKLRARLYDLSAPELLAALDEIAALDLAEPARRALEELLLGVLAEKDPRAALERFVDRLDREESGVSWQLGQALQRWAGEDPAGAIAWFDARIAAGDFESKSLDGKSPSRLRFEASLVAALLATDPATAGRRLAALPADQRTDLFQRGMFTNLKPGTEKAFADLVREHVPADQQAQAFSSVTWMMVYEGGLKKVGKFLDDIDARPDERAALAKKTAGSHLQKISRIGRISRQTVDELRGWIATQAPDAADRITGESLGGLWIQRTPFADRAGIIGELHAEGASDELLIGFLSGQESNRDPELARALAEKIGDEVKRAEILATLSQQPEPAPTIRPTPLR